MPEPSRDPSGPVVVRLHGDLDLGGGERWRGVLHDAASAVVAAAPGAEVEGARRAPALVVDLRAVTFLDCSGVRLLEELHGRCGGRAMLRAPSPVVRALLALAAPATTPPVEPSAAPAGGAGAGRDRPAPDEPGADRSCSADVSPARP